MAWRITNKGQLDSASKCFDKAGRRSLVLIVDLCFAVLYGQIQAKIIGSLGMGSTSSALGIAVCRFPAEYGDRLFTLEAVFRWGTGPSDHVPAHTVDSGCRKDLGDQHP
jgi:hypothetical protein